jgi:hypothetical protein
MTPKQEADLVEASLAHSARLRELTEKKAEAELAKALAEQRTAELVEASVRKHLAKSDDLTKLPRLS